MNEMKKYGDNVSLDEIKSEVKTSGSFSAWIFWRKIVTTSACVYEIDKTKAPIEEVQLPEQIENK
jgi:hypothetical protein